MATRLSDVRGSYRHEGHTLIEVLVAVGILAMMLVLMYEMVDGIFHATRNQSNGMECVATGRRALDVMTIDLQNGLFNGNSTLIAPTNASETNIFALVTNRRGSNSSSTPRFLAVSYSLNGSNQVVRSYGSIGFGVMSSLSSSLTMPASPSIPLAKGVLAVKALAVTDSTNYLLSGVASSNWAVTGSYNGHAVPSGYNAIVADSAGFSIGLTNCTHAIEVWIAVVDEQDYGLLKSSGKLAPLVASLGSDPTAWRAQVDAWTIPADVKSGIHIQKKTIPLP
ncbi:MAG: prepilin-type N-terminal cleavage/methylation domain-containing protein [Verrucomicrobia bacterium]|nr:prepilin-type N-terminal cleavage/methylation domain-containing protein [Verrucomicrobiota bacterium]